MIYLILKNYFTLFLAVGISSLMMIGLGIYGIIKIYSQPSTARKQKLSYSASHQHDQHFPNHDEKKIQDQEQVDSRSTLTISSTDIAAIAGEDVLATQLDLARAYIEADRKRLAKKILDYVIEQGSDAQQTEARNLLGLI